MHIYEKLCFLCSKKGVKVHEAAKEMGIDKGTVSKWKAKCEASVPVKVSAPIAEKMSSYFCVSLDSIYESDFAEKTIDQTGIVKTSSEIVMDLCRERNIPVSKLEKDLGFSNAYIASLRKGTFPADRAVKIAEYFHVDLSYILGSETKEEHMSEIKKSAIDMIADMNDDQVKKLIIIIQALK